MNTTFDDATREEGESPLMLIAAQYVLGTLSASARLRFQARLQQETELRALTHAWERRLNPLADLLNPQPVSLDVWQKIEARLDGLSHVSKAGSTATQSAALNPTPPILPLPARQKIAVNDSFWQPWAWMSTGIAAGLALFLFVRPELSTVGQQPPMVAQQRPAMRDVAVLSTDHNSPAWIVRQQGQSLILNALNAQAVPSDRDLELWSIHGQSAPRSLGVIHLRNGQATIPQVTADLMGKDVTLAISLEPKNGSPTGQPTGAVLYTGKIV
jgi:anti-sigma-K factor RskA